jgi:hypothetical protein
MAVTYTPAQRERAKADELKLVTLAVPGFEFQGPVTKEEAAEVEAFALAFYGRRAARIRADDSRPDVGNG